MAFSTLIEITIDGLARGMLFALLGAGITLVFGLGSILNIALGSFAVIAVIAGFVAVSLVVHPLAAALVGLGFVAALSLAVDRTMLTSVYRSQGEERIIIGIFTTLGLEILLGGFLFIYYPLDYSVPFESYTVDLLGIGVRRSSIVIIGLSAVILVGLFVFLRKTSLGKATRTVFQDETAALLCGINPRFVRTLIFVLSAVLAGIAGILWSIQSPLDASTAFEITVFAIIVSIVGGVRNIEGTIAAGIALGLVVTYANFFIGSYVSMVILFAVAVGVLILRPQEIS